MEKLISCCGLNCATCDARIATVKNDNDLRKATAEKWKAAYNAPNLTADSINCTGCREPGVKFSHCDECSIRSCARAKGFSTCGVCPDLNSCPNVSAVHKYVPEALTNLRDLN